VTVKLLKTVRFNETRDHDRDNLLFVWTVLICPLALENKTLLLMIDIDHKMKFYRAIN